MEDDRQIVDLMAQVSDFEALARIPALVLAGRGFDGIVVGKPESLERDLRHVVKATWRKGNYVFTYASDGYWNFDFPTAALSGISTSPVDPESKWLFAMIVVHKLNHNAAQEAVDVWRKLVGVKTLDQELEAENGQTN
jgi:hypothetical protein